MKGLEGNKRPTARFVRLRSGSLVPIEQLWTERLQRPAGECEHDRLRALYKRGKLDKDHYGMDEDEACPEVWDCNAGKRGVTLRVLNGAMLPIMQTLSAVLGRGLLGATR